MVSTRVSCPLFNMPCTLSRRTLIDVMIPISDRACRRGVRYAQSIIMWANSAICMDNSPTALMSLLNSCDTCHMTYDRVFSNMSLRGSVILDILSMNTTTQARTVASISHVAQYSCFGSIFTTRRSTTATVNVCKVDFR